MSSASSLHMFSRMAIDSRIGSELTILDDDDGRTGIEFIILFVLVTFVLISGCDRIVEYSECGRFH